MQEPTLRPVADPLFDTLDTIGSPIFVIERVGESDYQFVHLNHHFRTISKLDPARLTRGPIREIVAPRVADFMIENYDQVLSRGEPVCKDETYMIDGEATCWRTTLSRAPLGPEGRERIIGVAVPIDDLSDRCVDLASEIADLRAAIDETRTLARLSAHDLRAPLANVQSLTEIVLEDFTDLGDGKVEMIRACGEVAATALESIESLMARFHADLPDRAPCDEVDLGEICRGIVVLADPAGRLEISYPRARLACDGTVLGLGIRNLVDNAARFARSRIDMQLSADRAQGRLVLSIADDGPGLAGIDPVARALSGTPGPDGRGYGLGAVVSLLRSRGGELRTGAPRFGAGANLEIVLPGRVVEESRLCRAG